MKFFTNEKESSTRKGIDNSSIAYTLVSHNTVRGAAGASILDAEYLVKTGKINEIIE